MSKFPNAPLLEVIFELKWDIVNKSDIVDFQYLHGDLYSNFKEKYLFRESLIPPEVPLEVVKGLPVFRFRKEEKSYPLIQIGPGFISYNTIDSEYFWENFRKDVNDILINLNKIYPKYKELNLSPALTYIDFFPYKRELISPIEFINSNLQVKFSEAFLKDKDAQIHDINFTINYKIKEDTLSLNIADGRINNNDEGIILQTKVIGKNSRYKENELESWLDTAHELSSSIFKSLTSGELYESFK